MEGGEEKSTHLQTERGAVSYLLACAGSLWTPPSPPKGECGEVLCPLQSVPGWDDTRMEHAGARWMMPRASQAWSCCQLLGCCSWIPVPAPAWLLLGGDVPCSESRWWQLKAKYNSVEPTKNEQVETYVVQAGCRRRPSVGAVGHVSSQQGSKTESSSCKTQQTVS